ncbi:MAG: PIN domain-containing protein [Acidobacteriaceae bacterium]|nr:PIN domain-containing protein [Acidobacteriaceae bacterium]
MDAFFDTSVLIPTFYGEHEHHQPSFDLFLKHNKETGCTAAHCLVEVYSVLTGMPGKDRARPDEALLFIGDVRERLMIIALTEEEYAQTLQDAAAAGVMGGGIYDAVVARCALKADAKAIYTWNVKHFKRLGSDIALRVKLP